MAQGDIEADLAASFAVAEGGTPAPSGDTIPAGSPPQSSPSGRPSGVSPYGGGSDAKPADGNMEGGAPRDPTTGKFVKPADTAKPKPSAKPAQRPAATDQAQAAQAAPGDTKTDQPATAPTGDEAAKPPLAAPRGWSDDGKQAFAELPRALQEQIVKRESDRERAFSTGMQSIAAQRQRYAELDQVISPQRIQAWQINGMSPGQAINRLLAISDMADKDPHQFVQWYANQRGIDLGQLRPAEQDQNQPPADPQYRAIQEQLADTRKQVNDVLGFIQANQQQQVAGALANNAGEIDRFANQQDQQGNLRYPILTDAAHPNYQPFIAEFGRRIKFYRDNDPQRTIPAQTVLEHAYRDAENYFPDMRQAREEAEQRRWRAAVEAEAKKNAARAIAPAVSTRPGGPASSRVTPVGSPEDIMRQLMAQ